MVAVVPTYSLPTEAEALLHTGWWSSNGGANTWGTLHMASNNRINGSIPLEVFTCSSSTLDLSHNFIEGEIPHRDGNCVYVSNLDLSHNNPTGMIPDIFEAVDTVNLSYNSLQGPIPRYLIDSFGPDSFQGNKHLCGNLPGFSHCPASNKIVEIEQKSEDPHALNQFEGIL
ncbi:hypothetical protein V6N13_015794 [Hibiscus sabdariffa]